MNFDDTLADTIAAQYFRILARRAAIRAEIAELILQIQAIALHLDALQQHRRSKYTENVARLLASRTRQRLTSNATSDRWPSDR